MTLDAYLASNNLTEAAFAALIGVHQSSVHRMRKGAIRPDIGTLAKIVDATGGQVTLTDFVTSDGPGATHPDPSPSSAGASR